MRSTIHMAYVLGVTQPSPRPFWRWPPGPVRQAGKNRAPSLKFPDHRRQSDLFTSLDPPSIHPPFAPYSHGVVVAGGQKLVFCSGQLGIAADGSIPPDCAGQAQLCFDSVAAILAEAGLGLRHVVRINAYVTGREHLAGYMSVRNALFGAPYPASTLMIVSGFARPEFVVEIEVVAAGPEEE